jgi:hypothetical protein
MLEQIRRCCLGGKVNQTTAPNYRPKSKLFCKVGPGWIGFAICCIRERALHRLHLQKHKRSPPPQCWSLVQLDSIDDTLQEPLLFELWLRIPCKRSGRNALKIKGLTKQCGYPEVDLLVDMSNRCIFKVHPPTFAPESCHSTPVRSLHS